MPTIVTIFTCEINLDTSALQFVHKITQGDVMYALGDIVYHPGRH